MSRKPRLVLIATALTVLAGLTGVGVAVAATSPAEAGGLTATFAKTADWGTGYEATYTVSNHSPTQVSGWRVGFTLPSTARLGSFWEADISPSGAGHLAVNRSYNGSLDPGASTRFGFIVTGSGAPTGCTINGSPCGGQTPTGGASPSVSATRTAAPTTTAPGPSPTGTGDSPTATAPAPTGSPIPAVAPYVDMGAWPTPSLTSIMSSSGIRGFTLGFVTGAGCKASWFGAYDPRTAWAKDQIDAVRAAGGAVRVSFGGASGVELAQGCADVASLEAEYRAVVDAYRLTAIDLDIEGAATADPGSVDRRSKAIAQLQRNRPGLRVSYTLPVLPEGLTADGLNVLKSAISNGVTIDLVNIMAMDYYRSGSYGDFAVQAAQSTATQLRALYPSAGDAEIWQRIGVTPMLGKNDDGNVFDQAAARQLVSFAAGKHLGLLSFWELTRDANACTGALYKCTNVTQQPYEFSRIFAGYGG